jgi:alkylated DNA nucleotide flippase Atl1
MSDQTDALANLARSCGAALVAFADAIGPEVARGDAATKNLADLALGKRQQEIAEVPGLNSDTGMRANEIANEIAYDQANTHTALKALSNRGVLEEVRVAAGEPTRWRLVPEYRGLSDPYVRMAGFVRRGEWTTYGDISVAVRGDMSGARAVGRAAATLQQFPSPHRVLYSKGQVPPTWKSDPSGPPDPQECVRRLEAESVTFDTNGQADRKYYVSWDVLVERSEREG